MPRKRWITAGVAIAALAVALLGVALYFAVSQARAVALLRITVARHDAIQLRTTALIEVRQACRRTLSTAAAHFALGHRNDPYATRRTDEWLGDIFIWDGSALTRWPGPDGSMSLEDSLVGLIQQRLDREFFGTHAESSEPSLAALPEPPAVVVATFVHDVRGGTPIAAGVLIDPHALKRDLLDGHFAVSGRLALVHRDQVSASPWIEPIGDALPWVVVPTSEFVQRERSAVFLHAAVFVAIGFVFLVVLIVMVWKLIGVVQREIALSRLKSSFVADVSHELKTPLALIRMFSEMLSERRVTSEEKRQEYYEIITRESSRLTNLIDNILDFSRIDAGRKAYDLKPIDVTQVVRGTYDSYKHDLDRHGFEHKLVVAEGLPHVAADPDAIAQLVVNLIGNAIKYSHDEKRLDIDVAPETRRGKHGVLISIADSGIGISAEDRAHMFDGFFRASDDRVRKVRGTGLGLAVVKHIVDAHGGIVDVESRLVKGTVFRVFLPQAAKEP